MPNYGNNYTDTVSFTVHLSRRDAALFIALAKEAKTKTHIYLEESLERFLDCKRHPDTTPNTYQRLALNAAVCASGVERE
jgi:hypothetical protein